MLGIPKQSVGSSFFSGDLLAFFKTLGHLGDGVWQTALVSAVTLAILIVFGRWLKVIPGGLVAVIGMITLSWIFDFAAHHVSILGPVPSGLPSLGMPHGVTWDQTTALTSTAVAMFVVILAQSAATSRAYAVKYNERFDENTDLVGLGLANIAAGFSGTFVVNGSPTKTEMVDEAKSHTQVAQVTTAVVVAIVLLSSPSRSSTCPNCVLSSVVFLIALKLIDIKGMRDIYRLRLDEFCVAALTAAVVVVVGVEQGVILAIVLSIVLHVRRHHHTADFVLTRDSRGHIKTAPPTPGTLTAPDLIVYRFGAGVFYANVERLTEEVLGLVDGDTTPRWLTSTPPRSTTSTTPAARRSPSSPTSFSSATSCSRSARWTTACAPSSTRSASPRRWDPSTSTTPSKTPSTSFVTPAVDCPANSRLTEEVGSRGGHPRGRRSGWRSHCALG